MKPLKKYVWLGTCGKRGIVDISWDKNRYPCQECYNKLREGLLKRIEDGI